MKEQYYEEFLRNRITELRLRKNVSEHRMSLDLGKSGSYIRGISNGTSMPSLRELFNIFSYLGISPAEFFAPLEAKDTLYARLCERMSNLSESDLEKIDTFINWLDE